MAERETQRDECPDCHLERREHSLDLLCTEEKALRLGRFGRLSPEERYARDVDYQTLVRMLEAFIAKAQYTPTEMREAAILACIHYEMNNIPYRYLAPKEVLRAIDRAEGRLGRLKALLELEEKVRE